MSLFGKNNKPQIGFKKLPKSFIHFEDAPNKLCEIGYMINAQASISKDANPEVVSFKSAGAWEAVNGNRFYFGE